MMETDGVVGTFAGKSTFPHDEEKTGHFKGDKCLQPN